MLNCAKAVTLMVLAATQVFAAAQTAQAKPSPQQRADAPPPAKAPARQPASPDSKRFVSNENFFRAGVRPQPADPAVNPSQPAVSASSPAGVNRSNSPAPLAMPQTAQPVVAAAVPPPSVSQPSLTPTASPAVTDHEPIAAVDYLAGQLTVIADHAPLGQVLKLIGAKTGAVIDLAPELQQEPVMAKLGPMPVREALTGLLDSPRIDYIVFGSGDAPGSLQRIMVRRRQSFGTSGMGVMRAPQPEAELVGDQANPTGQVISRRTITSENAMTQEQKMEDWKKQRAQMLEAEMKQQAQERESEKYQTQEPPTPQETPQQQDNPPQL